MKELNIKAESYAINLKRQNWNKLCHKTCGKVSVSKTWKLLRALIDPNGTRTATNHHINKSIHLAERSKEDVIQLLAHKYLCTDPPEDQPEYEGEPKEELHRPITAEELRAELTLMKKTAAPCPDSITARHLFNLDEDTIAQLVEHFNREYLDLGVHNTVEEAWEAQKLAQMRRLNRRANGKWLLAQLGLTIPGGQQEPLEDLTLDMRKKMSPDRLDAKMEHAVFRAGRASDAGPGCITRWLPAALAREARRMRAIADDRSTTPCGVMSEESDSVVEKLIEGIRPHP
ncbi:hypothetical protein HPB47_016577 [Ixodes persulcatus]|uniref:Uncharacterized protein n=1 Tax=Ixodes persulcatus TaxID=34615 RepID=A0AC60QQN7_IXOPE|nr:hypothetical protein HPB47_016577 [Ixodes persulcatus]